MSTEIEPEPRTLGEIVALWDPACESDAESRCHKWLQLMSTPSQNEMLLDTLPPELAQTSLLYMEWLNLLRQLGGAISLLPAMNKPRESLEVPHNYPAAMHHLWQCDFSLPSTAVPPSFWKYIRDRTIMGAAAFRASIEWYYWAKHRRERTTDFIAADLQGILAPEIAPRINTTPWLDSTPHVHLPHYLWDLANKRTVEVEKLLSKPDYVAISHTWGRFRKLNQGKPCYTSVQGVPWEVPEVQITKFDVLELPDLFLRGLKERTDYVWFDLFCIPQDRSPLSLQEISRQASIFKNSSGSLIWLNEIVDWTGTRAVLHHLCCSVIEDAVEIGLIPEAGDRSNLPALTREVELVAMNDLNPWFTSLWTLQEICLCPGMTLCNRSFESLRIAEGLRPLALLDLQALVDETSNKNDRPEQVEHLKAVLWNVTLSRQEHWTPMTILHLGNERYCEKRRAEAIMSAVGAVDWFNSSPSAILDQEQNLILGTYPPAFIAELRAKHGSGPFFNAAKPKYDIISHFLFNEASVGNLEHFGSMLPFGPGSYSAGVPSVSGQSSDITTETWTIDEAGRLHIREAFVQLSPDDEDSVQDLLCNFKAPVHTNSKLREEQWRGVGTDFQSLSRWIKEFQPGTKAFAVRLTLGDFWCQGVLLKQLKSGSLLKVGLYTLGRTRADIPWPGKKCEVDWIVL